MVGKLGAQPQVGLAAGFRGITTDGTGTWPPFPVSGSGISVDSGRFSIKGNVDDAGSFAAVVGRVSTGSTYQGQIAGNGSVLGTWRNRKFDESGTFTGAQLAAGMIVNVGSGLCLSGSGLDGVITLARCARGADQRFTLVDGTLRLYGDLCLDKPPTGSNLKRSAMTATICTGSARQDWSVEQKSSNRLINRQGGCAVVNNNRQAGNLLTIRGRSGCKGGGQSKQFALIPEAPRCISALAAPVQTAPGPRI